MLKNWQQRRFYKAYVDMTYQWNELTKVVIFLAIYCDLYNHPCKISSLWSLCMHVIVDNRILEYSRFVLIMVLSHQYNWYMIFCRMAQIGYTLYRKGYFLVKKWSFARKILILVLEHWKWKIICNWSLEKIGNTLFNFFWMEIWIIFLIAPHIHEFHIVP